MDESRRRWLRAIPALGAAGVGGLISDALAAGDIPPGLHRLEGTATINGRPAKAGMPVSLGDRIATGPRSEAVVVLKGDAMLMRADTVIEVKGRDGVLSDLLVAGGKVLMVFAKKPVAIRARTASIGIRGTGAYLELQEGGVYFCLCYGEALIEGPGMAGANAKLVQTRHHEAPLLLRDGGGSMRAEPGPVENHTDAELTMLEALVGREPPFVNDPGPRY
jgi:hypothetical protein